MRMRGAAGTARRGHPLRNILIILLVLVVVVLIIGYKVGILKMTIEFVDAREDKESIAIETIEYWAVDQEGTHAIYKSAFDEDGNGSIKLSAGTYQWWINYDGFLASDAFTTDVSLSNTPTVQLLNAFVPDRYLLIEFVDGEEKQIQLESLTITDESGTAYEYVSLANGMVMLEFDNDTAEVSLVIQADEYEEVTAVVDLTESRTMKLMIMFQE